VDSTVVSIAAAAILALLAIVGVATLIRWYPSACATTVSADHFGPRLAIEPLPCKAFISTPEFLVWLELLCAQGAFWALAAIPVFQTVRGLVRELRFEGGLTATTIAGIAVSGIALISLAAAYTFARQLIPTTLTQRTKYPADWPLAHHSLRIDVLSGIGFSISALAVVGIWLAGIEFHRIAGERRADLPTVEHFLDLRNRLNSLLATVGIIIGLATLATGALRNVFLALNDPAAARPVFEFDAQYVLVYGFFLSGLLAIAFAPSYLAMRAAGAQLRDLAYPLPPPGHPTFTGVVKERGAFDDYLQTSLSASASFKAGVAIVTPLAGSLLGLLIPKFT
jgi:hypothetical protein